MRFGMVILVLAGSVLACLADSNAVSAKAESSNRGATPAPALSPEQQRELAQRAEQVRMQCIEGRRYVCGRIVQVLTNGLVVDSGYSALLNPPFNQSWVVRGNVSVTKSASLVEEKKPDAICVGVVLLTNFPKRPKPNPYDYVVIHGYPAGEYLYTPVPGVQKKIREFSASLERAVSAKLAAGEK